MGNDRSVFTVLNFKSVYDRFIVCSYFERRIVMEYNFQLIENVITRREIPEVIPLYEHFVDDPVIEQIMGYKISKIDTTF